MTKGYQTFTDAATATGLTDRELVFVAGETDIGDTGQGHFIYRPAGTGAASIDIIVVTAGGRMFRATMPSSDVADQIAAAIQGGDTPVSVSTLPATAATAANQALIKAAVDAVAAAITAAGANATAAAIASAMQGGTQPISATSLPLPADAATSTKQDTLSAAVAAVTAAVSAQGANVTAAQIDTVLRATPIAVTGGQTVQETANAFGTAPASVAPGSVAGLLAGPLHLAPAAGTVAVLANAVTATGAQTAVTLPKAFVDFTFILTGTGAISATCVIEKSDGTNWFPAATMTLSGTTSVSDSDWFDNVWTSLRANITAISGTGAALTVRAGY